MGWISIMGNYTGFGLPLKIMTPGEIHQQSVVLDLVKYAELEPRARQHEFFIVLHANTPIYAYKTKEQAINNWGNEKIIKVREVIG